MGEYENPTIVLDDKSGIIIANAIAGLGQTTVDYINKYDDKRNEEIKQAALSLEKEIAEQHKEKYQVRSNIAKSNILSESWYNMTDKAVDRKYALSGQLTDAVGEERAAISTAIQREEHKIRLSIISAKQIEEWKKGPGRLLAESTMNQPGGIFSGSNNTSEWSKKINLNYKRKQAVIGNLIQDGKSANVEYFYKDINGIDQIFATINGGEEFNVMDTLNEEYVEMDNVLVDDKKNGTKGINTIYKETGIQKNGKFISSLLGAPIKNPVYDTEEKLYGYNFIRPVKTLEVLGQLIDPYEQKFFGIAEAVNTESEYNNINATLLGYVKDAKPLEKVRDDVYELTTEAKAKYVKAMVGFSLEERIPSYEIIDGVETTPGYVTFRNESNQEVTEKIDDTYTSKSGIEYKGYTPGEATTPFADQIDKSMGFEKFVPPTEFKFNKAQEGKIKDTVEQLKSGKGYNKLIGQNIEGKKLKKVLKGEGGKVTFIYDDKDPSNKTIEEKDIPGYKDVVLTKDQLTPLVKDYLIKQYGMKASTARTKMQDKIIEDILKKEEVKESNSKSGGYGQFMNKDRDKLLNPGN